MHITENALFRLAFAAAPEFQSLNLMLHAITRRLILQKAHGQAWQAIALPYLVSIRFQVLFHSPPGVLFTFPSRYWFTIGHCLVFSLTRWSSQIPTKFHVLRSTQVSTGRPTNFKYRTFTFCGAPFKRFFYSRVL